jgi:hypothetical protein
MLENCCASTIARQHLARKNRVNQRGQASLTQLTRGCTSGVASQMHCRNPSIDAKHVSVPHSQSTKARCCGIRRGICILIRIKTRSLWLSNSDTTGIVQHYGSPRAIFNDVMRDNMWRGFDSMAATKSRKQERVAALD